MKTKNNIILTNTQINHKIRRIALQILESNIYESKIILAGISKNGFFIAKKLKQAISDYSDVKIILCEVFINKKELLNKVTVSINIEEYTNESVILIDDVLHSGATLIYGVKHFLNVPLKQLKTAVLINRNHKKFPIKADFKGLSLSTSINEHVEIVFNNNTAQAVLI
ncbi:MAG: phosphoribosyltransferase [Flavobacteriaceae bacterium]|nr:phosphoribosyltransferase [Flavobacteriaceae bacterium]